MEQLIQKLIEMRPALKDIKLDKKNDYQAVVDTVGKANLKFLAGKAGVKENQFVWAIIEQLEDLQEADQDLLDLFN